MGLSLADWIEQNNFSDLEEDIRITLQEGTSVPEEDLEQATRLIMIMVRQKFESLKDKI